MIATTFTRAASAELKNRIRVRLVQTLRYIETCQTLTEAEIQVKMTTETDPLLQKCYTIMRLGLILLNNVSNW